MTSPVQELATAKYALLTTYRRNGSGVSTPVWTVPYGAGLAFWTGVSTGKLKRIRRNPAVALATCDFRGNNAGPETTGTATVLDQAGTAEVRRLIRRKYGLTGWLTLTASRLRGGLDRTVGVHVEIARHS